MIKCAQLIKRDVSPKWILFATLALLATTLACKPGTAVTGSAEGSEKKAVKAAPVAVQQVKIGEASSIYETTATLEAEQQADVLARTSGVVREINVEEGDQVEAGQILIALEDDSELLNLKLSRIKMTNLQREYARLKKVHEKGILSSQDFEVIENRVEEAKAEVEKAELTLSYTKIQAPFSGTLVRRYLDVGAHVQPGTAVFKIMDTTPLLARIHIPANRMGRVQVGQNVDLALDSTGIALEGRLRLVSPIVDASTGTVKVTAEIGAYPAGTRPGDFAQVRIVTEQHQNALLVESVSVFEDKGEQVVYTVLDGKARRVVVQLGFVERGVTEIVDGLEMDALVVVKGQRNLRDGMAVEILEGPKTRVSGGHAPEAAL